MTVVEIIPNSGLLNHATTSIGLGGLRATDGRVFPLVSVNVRASLAGPCAHTIIEQHFANPFDETLDVTWIFPLPDTGAIVELELRAGDIRVVGECQERAAAIAAFEAARRDGKRAALVEKEQGSVHTLSLAGLPARSEVTVRLSLVELLPSIDGRFRWHFPTTIAPRYTPGLPVGHSGFGIEADTTMVPNASRLSPPLRLDGGTVLDLEVEIAGPLGTVESSLHAVKLSLDSGAIRVAPSARATLNKDFILEFSTAETDAPVTRAWTDGSHTLVLLEPPSNVITTGLPRDAVFVVDISGSMQGEKLDAAKVALRGALHGLRTGDRFKLLAFDDRLERFANDFSTYNDNNLNAADSWIARLESRGGTEMLEAIQESLAGNTPDGRLRTVLFITDGQSNDEARLLPAVANRKGNALFFTLGIDTAVNAALLKSLAAAGGGVCELCTPFDDIDAIVARLEMRFGTPLLADIKLEGAARPDGHVVFAGRPASVLLDNAPAIITIHGTNAAGPFTATVAAVPINFPLGALWAMERVSWLEERLLLRPFEEEALRPEILRIALQWHISSRFTAFVCVDHSTTNTGERRHVVQPTELPESWELEDVVMGGAMPTPAFAAYSQSPQQNIDAPELEGDPSTPYFDDLESVPEAAPETVYYSPPPMLERSPEQQTPGSSSAGSEFSTREAFGEAVGRLFSFAKKDVTSRIAGAHRVQPDGDMGQKIDAGALARSQSANGSFGGDIGRTAAAVLVLLMLGHTRRKGDRRRTVQKAADWLAGHDTDARAALALAALKEAENTGTNVSANWRVLVSEGREGRMLGELLDQRGGA